MKKRNKFFLMLFFVFVFFQTNTMTVFASNVYPMVNISLGEADNPNQVVSLLQMFFMLTLIGLAPFMLLMMTSFTRTLISLHFLRSALGTQQMPPNQVLIGIALFLTMFTMGPVFTEINETAIKPYVAQEMSQEETIEKALIPIRGFMFKHAENKDINLFIGLSGETYETPEDIPNRVLFPAFILGELTKGFIIGFCIYIPFLVIDMVVASVLMAMGMMMLPPAMISLPFKLLLFIIADGWSLIIKNIMYTFR